MVCSDFQVYSMCPNIHFCRVRIHLDFAVITILYLNVLPSDTDSALVIYLTPSSYYNPI